MFKRRLAWRDAMPNSILSSLLSKASLSIKSNATGLDIATNLKVSRVMFKYCSRVMRHKREDGTSIVDARIILPSVVEIDVICETIDDLALVNAVMLDRTTVYTIKSKGLIIENMMSEVDAIRQTSDVISATPIRMSFTSLLIQGNSKVPSVQQPSDSSLIDKGLQDISQAVQGVQGLITNVQTTVLGLAAQVKSNLGL